MCTWAHSVRSHVCVEAQVYLRLTCGPGSRQVEAWPETKCPASSSLSQMTLLTDLTLSIGLSPGRPPPPPTITTTHSSLSWLIGLSYTTAAVTSHLLRFLYVCVVHLSHKIQMLIFELFSSCSSEKIMDSNVNKHTYWAFLYRAHRISSIQPFSLSAVILLSLLRYSLGFWQIAFSHI